MCKLGTVGSLFQHLSPRPVWWMRVEIDSGSQLSSISAFWKVQTPQRLFWDFWPDKTITTSWSGSKVQVAPAGHLAITFKGYSRRQSKVLTAKSNAELLGSTPALLEMFWLASTNKGSFLVGRSCCWQRQAHFGKTCYHSCDTDSVLESVRF